MYCSVVSETAQAVAANPPAEGPGCAAGGPGPSTDIDAATGLVQLTTLVQAIYARDYLVVQGMALVAAVAFVVINFFVNFLLTVLDPRVRRA